MNIKEAMSRSKEYINTLARKRNWLGSGKLNKEKIWNTKAKEWATVVIKTGALRSLGRHPGRAQGRGIMCFTKSDRDEYSTPLITLQLTGMCLRKRNLNVSNKTEFSKSAVGGWDQVVEKRMSSEWVQTNLKKEEGKRPKWPSKVHSNFSGLAFFLVFESPDKELWDGGSNGALIAC